MSQTITIRLTKASSKVGPFTITDEYGEVIATDVSIDILVQGISYTIADNVTLITLTSTGNCKVSKTMRVVDMYQSELLQTEFVSTSTACLWRHLTNIEINNTYYGVIRPYIIEYPFAYQFQDEILQNVKDYTKVWKYVLDGTGVFSYTDKILLDNAWFNKAILYNAQQCTGILELVPKPMHNLQAYNAYPIYKTNSKVITYTKSDSFYQYNTFWNVVKDKHIQIAVTSCENLSIDGVVNQANMDYTTRSYRKDPLRAKDLKIRHILDSRGDIHMVSQFIISPSQISYK